MRRCLLIPTDWGGFGLGIERTLSAIARGLRDRGHRVELGLRHPIDLERAGRVYGVDLDGVLERRVPSWTTPLRRLPLVGRPLHGVRVRRAFRRLTADYDLALVQSSYIPPACGAARSVLFTEFPRDPQPSSRDWRDRLASYDLLLGNSEFTCSWIRRYWQTDCEVLYPSIQECRPLAKERAILGVGRFSRGGREKGQLEMVQTFRRLVDEGLSDCRLWLAGLPESQDYLDDVREAARGYPVELFVGASAEELADLYGRASLFWHTVGMGVDGEAEPARLEHFGIVVAEAMTAGCVPLVYDAGGPREIVEDGELRWTNLDQLASRTVELLDRRSRLERLGRRCRRTAVERFGHEAFERAVDRIAG